MSVQALKALNLVDFNWVTPLESVWSDGPLMEPDNNQKAYNAILEQLRKLAENPKAGPSLGRVVIGQGGSGKTHLAKLLCGKALEEGYHFVLVDCTDVRDFWETVLLSYVKSLLRPFRGETQVRRLLTFLFAEVAGSQPPPGFFNEMAGVSSEPLQVYTEFLLKMEPVKKLLDQPTAAALPIRQIIRALCLLHSSDENLHDLGYGWLLGHGLESAEAAELKLTGIGIPYTHAVMVKGLSWLMAQHSPTLVVLDQLDPIIAQYHLATALSEGANDERLLARAIIEGLGGGLSKLYDNTFRTVSTVFLLNDSWEKLQATTLKSNLDRFLRPPLALAQVESVETIKSLLRERLSPAYKSAAFTPPYPTYPFPESQLGALKGRYPRQLLQLFSEYREKCLAKGAIEEFTVGPAKPPSIDSIQPPAETDFSKLLKERAAAVNAEKLLAEDQEDALGDRLATLCEAIAYEVGNTPAVTLTVDTDFKGGNYPSLHARLKRISHAEGEREDHFCLRALQKADANPFRVRLGAALTEAGIDQGLSFRRLILIRNNAAIPGGPATKTRETYDRFLKAGGKVYPLPIDELRTIEAVRTLLQQKTLYFTAWLGREKPLSQLPTVKKIFADLLAGTETSPPAPSPKPLAEPVAKTEPTIPVETSLPAPSPTTEAPKPPAATSEPLVLPLGQHIIANAPHETITIPLAALTRHVAIRAGSGGGKTVLVKRLIEEAALQGIPSIVLDPGNDLAWLGDPWPTPPSAWLDGDAAKAKRYFENTEVAIWTPGKSQGRPLSLPVLPNLKDVADDRDSLNDAVAMAQASLIPLCASGKSTNAIRKQGVLTAALKAFAKLGGNLNAFIDYLSEVPAEGTGNINNGAKLAAEMADTLRASVLNNPLLEEGDHPLDIGVLFGIGRPKTRVSVVSFIGLPSLDAQQQFVNQLAMALFTWIKKNPSVGDKGVSGLFVIDEAKDFLPGGSSSAPCKKSLMRLAAQARKYGLGMILATQNPKDIDYNAVAQFSTQFFGRANSPQVIDFIDEMLQAKGGSGEGVARLQKGQFFVASSEGLASPVKIKAPLCLSNHPDGRPLTENEVIQRATKSLG